MGEKILKINSEDSKRYYLLINFGDSVLNLTLVESNMTTKEVEVLGNEELYTKEIKEGFIKNMEAVQAELRAGVDKLKESVEGDLPDENLHVICTISSSLGERVKSQGMLHFINDEITEENIEKVIQLALYNSDISQEAMPINYSASGFKVDGASISNPISMSGKKLEVELDIQTVEKNLFNNFKKVISGCGLEFEYIQFDTDNIIDAILSEEDRDYGSVLLEFGLEFSRMVFVKKNTILKSVKVSDSANKVIAKIAQYYGLKYPEAVKIYQNLDFIMEYSRDDGYFEIERSSTEVQTIELDVLKGVITSALESTFEGIYEALNSNKDSIQFSNGIVFVNNTKLTEGMDSVVGDVFENEVLTIKKYSNIKANNRLISNMDILENKFDILGDVKFVGKRDQYRFDHMDLRYPRQTKREVKKIDLKHLEEFGQGKSKEDSDNKKPTVLGSVKRAIIDLW